MSFSRVFLVGIVFLLWAINVRAEDNVAPFSISPVWPLAIRLDGPIDSRSALSFRRMLAANPNVKILVLNSPGGDVQNGLLIADDVYTKGMSTVIPSDSVCASACAYVFFAGRNRIVQGRLGVHQISGNVGLGDAQLNISDILDTLNKYGVDARIFPIMFRTLSDDIHFFSADEIKQFGIEHLSPDAAGSQISSVPSSTPTIQSAPASVNAMRQEETTARNFVSELVNSGSLPANQAVAFASSVYAGEVNFYGKQKRLSEILDDKAKFFERWPNRVYRLRPESVVVSCGGDLCRVTGDFDWYVSSPQRAKSLNGTASFFYSLSMNGRIQVVAEDGKARK
nr:ATP-dependent Clp protease proteolytic subunit [Rhizobium sp. P44RR-XXIV]